MATRHQGNPFYQAHLAAERAFNSDGTSTELVDMEYLDAPEPMACPVEKCGGTLFYKAIVGAMKCPDCGALADCNGDLYR